MGFMEGSDHNCFIQDKNCLEAMKQQQIIDEILNEHQLEKRTKGFLSDMT